MIDAASRVSVHSALWAKQWGQDLASYIVKASSLGYSGVEISLLGIESSGLAALAATARDVGVELKCTTGLSPEHDVSSVDSSVRGAGVAFMRSCADVVATLGSDLLAGVIYAPWGVFGSPESRRERLHWAAESLSTVAPDFQDRGITLGIEAINRFETDLVNTASQAMELADEVDAPNVGVHLDTFHMNIEERDVHAAVKISASRLVHVHVSGSDRGRPVTDRFPWGVFFNALREIDYQKWIGVEMFVQAEIPVSSDLRIWRTIEASPDDAAAEARNFVLERIARVD
ncbi:MAG TPA: sugar phosphate isomerase/epimerase family protein [Acidimicrobiales bacterium]|nr:sugar phosphate isomerase/epimerase family protein [Acidimicrobiales bacterium]